MVTRIRVDAEGFTQEECKEHINAVFALLHQNSMSVSMSFGSGQEVVTASSVPVVSGETEFLEEVYETQITEHGAIHWKGRRVIRYL